MIRRHAWAAAAAVAFVVPMLVAVRSTATPAAVSLPVLGSSIAAPPVPIDNPRPPTCPPVPAQQGGPDAEPQSTTGSFPWPSAPKGVNPEDYAAYDRTPVQTPPVRPANWDNGSVNWQLTSARTTFTPVSQNPQELCGVEGGSVDEAWQTTTGRPDTVIAITDSGIEWCNAGIVDKVYLNRQALPLPENAAGLTKPQLEKRGVHFVDTDPYDLDNSGVFNVVQYARDPRIVTPFFCKTFISPEDLIRAFTKDGKVGPKGFTEAIAGWNFVDDNNDPYDDVHYDHGTGEARDSTGEADSLGNAIGTCPNCMVLPIRVGQSFIAEGNDFARGVMFAIDSGASVIQEALGTMDETDAAEQAIAYANAHGVPVIASAADEEAEHRNEPANFPGTIVVNSVTQADSIAGLPAEEPPSYLYVNGCTNYGANIAVSVESSSCSSEAAGKTGGIAGLIESEARNLVQGHLLGAYPGVKTTTGQPVALSATEVRELIEMAADDIDFQTAAPPFGLPDNYLVVSPDPTTRYKTQPGYDMYSGYGRLDAATILGWLSAGKIPPEASLDAMEWFRTYDPTTATLDVDATAAAVRTPGRFRWTLQYGIGTQPEPGAWYDLASGTATKSAQIHVPLGPGTLQKIADRMPPTNDPTGGTGPDGRPDPDAFAFTLRLVTVDANGLVGMDRRTDYLEHDPNLIDKARLDGSIDAPPTLAPIGPQGENALIIATAAGTIHAYVPGPGGGLEDLAGWPVHTVTLADHDAEKAVTSKGVAAPVRGSIVGGVAVGNLDGKGLDIVVGDMTGRVYAWDANGRLLPGFPVHSNPNFSAPSARDGHNRLLPGFFAAPALAPLEGGSKLDIVASSDDRHVYAWRPDGKPVPGWPVLVVDPAEVQSVDPVTNHITFKPGSGVGQGTKLIDTPAIGNLDGGSGPPDVVVDTNEEYAGTPNVTASDVVNYALGALPLLSPSNSRIYALDPRGTLARHTILPGWPAAIADFDDGLLPDVGDGTTASPALADLKGNGTLETGIMTTAGPGYILNPNGTSYLGTGPDGKDKVVASVGAAPLGNSPEYPTLPSLGMPIFAPLGPAAPGISFIAPAASVFKALDAALAGNQILHDNQLDVWSTATGALRAAFPQVVNDLQFFVQPIAANIDGGTYIVEGSADSDVRAIDALGREAPDFPKFTGDWMVQSPSFGPWGGDATQVLAAGMREGDLFIWSTSTPRCASSGPWPRQHHDLWNTSDLDATGPPAYACHR